MTDQVISERSQTQVYEESNYEEAVYSSVLKVFRFKEG